MGLVLKVWMVKLHTVALLQIKYSDRPVMKKHCWTFSLGSSRKVPEALSHKSPVPSGQEEQLGGECHSQIPQMVVVVGSSGTEDMGCLEELRKAITHFA